VTITSWLRAILRCPDCRGPLLDDGEDLECPACARSFPVDDGIPDLLGAMGGVNLGELETQDHVSELYEEARYQRPHARAFHRANLLRMCRMVRLDGRVLDAGCGNGFFFDAARELVAPGAELVGLDLSPKMLELARQHHDVLVRGDATRLPFADACFDTVLARSLLHHLPDPDAGAREIARVLRPGGELVVLDTHKTVVSTLPRTIANRGEHFDEDHKNFRTGELTSLVGRHLEVTSVEYMGYVAYPLLGFPDLIDFGRFLPMKLLARPLIGIDQLAARVPGLRRLGWGIVVKAVRS
jgi:ubiquinone/menaquinone biosynthesis C-methylase UbiE